MSDREERSSEREPEGDDRSPERSPQSNYSGRHKRSRSRSYSPRNNRSVSRSPGSRRRQFDDKEKPSPCRCLGVFGLSLYTQTRHLRDVFSKYGNIDEITIVTDAQTGRSRGFAFVYFENIDDAESAKDACNGIEIDNRKIRVDFSITKRPHTPTPGIYMGRPTPYVRRPRYGRSSGYYDRGYDDQRGGNGGDYDGYRREYRDDYRRHGGDYHRRSPSPYGRRYRRSRSRSYSPAYQNNGRYRY